MICPCKYPLVVIREGVSFIAFPLDIFTDEQFYFPVIYESEDEHGKWMTVQWKDDVHDKVKSYNIAGHVVIAGCEEDQLKCVIEGVTFDLAGCEEDQLECDSKSIYLVRHPKEDWDSYHVIDMDKIER